MKIIIVGAGKVGATLVENLRNENHDVSVIDPLPAVIEEISTLHDVLGIVGSGACCEDLREAGANKADVLIAASPQDEINILSCVIARKMGTKRCIARIRDPKLAEEFPFLSEQLGVSNMVNPEYYAASEIARILRTPSAIKVDSFAKGRIDLAEIKVEEKSLLDGLPLHRLPQIFKSNLLICAVAREGDVCIPGGDFILKADDRIHVTAPHSDLTAFFRLIGAPIQRVRSVMIIGGGRIAYYLTKQLLDSGIAVKIIEVNRERCQALSDAFPKATIVCGDGTDQDILVGEGLSTYDACVALTGIDEENIILSMFARSQTDAKVITKINKPSLNKMTASVGLDSLISPKLLTANTIVQYVRAMQNAGGSSVVTLYKLVDGRVEALEFMAREGCRAIGIPLRELSLKKDLLIAGIIRGTRIIIPKGNDRIERDDSVIIVTTNRFFDDLDDIVQ